MNTSTNRKSTFRFPFDIDSRVFLVLAAFFFILSIKSVNQWVFPNVTISNLKSKIEHDISSKINSYHSLSASTSNFKMIFDKSMTERQVQQLSKLPYSLFVFQNDELIFWNTASIGPPKISIPFNVMQSYESANGFFLLYKSSLSEDKSRYVVVLIKLKNEYPFTSTFLKIIIPFSLSIMIMI
jgi:hypothetical protein